MQEFRADLHIHSRYSRATSTRLTPGSLAAWAALKGLTVLGTGDFTHPAWRAELRDQMVFDEASALYRLADSKAAAAALPDWADWFATRPDSLPLFMPQAEISSIYKRGGKVRKVHSLVYMPNFECVEKFCQKLGELGNLNSDGRPILGLDARNLLEMVLEAHPKAFLIPAHIWTPWFSLFGSKSGFDSMEECFADLSEHIFALETGLSSDPAMNRTISALDKYRMVSNSDAHSGENLGREANIFTGTPSYDGIYSALRGIAEQSLFTGTLEFFPDEGKYHLDGHRACNVALTPQETKQLGGICPVCGKPVTVGVLNRVLELADRDTPAQLPGESFSSLIPLAELLSEVLNVGSKSRKVMDSYAKIIRRFGPELDILRCTPEADLSRFFAPLAEGIGRMRRGEVTRQGGYDGEYGVIRVFTDDERRTFTHGTSLLKTPETETSALNLLEGLPVPEKKRRSKPAVSETAKTGKSKNKNPMTAEDDNFAFYTLAGEPAQTLAPPTENAAPAPENTGPASDSGAGEPQLAGPAMQDRLNPAQEQAVLSGPGPVLVLAGPGSGKTRTLIARCGHLIEDGINPKTILAVTFTRRAAAEVDARLAAALGPGAALPRTDTLHALAFELWLRIYAETPVLLSEESALRVFSEANANENATKLREAWQAINVLRESMGPLPPEQAHLHERYITQKTAWNLVDYTDLLEFWLQQTQSGKYTCPWQQVLVDEVQDLSTLQLTIIKSLLPPSGEGFFGIGDPNQSIYAFRGAHGDVAAFFHNAWPALHTINLKQNYRSAAQIVSLASALLSKNTNAPVMEPMCALPAELHLFEAPSAEAEATWIAGEIRRLIGSGSHTLDDASKSALSRKDGQPSKRAGKQLHDPDTRDGQDSHTEKAYSRMEGSFAPGDFAVLVRARSLILPIQRALHRAGIPCSVPAADAFWADPRAVKILDAAGRMLGIGGSRLEADEYRLGVSAKLKENLNAGVNAAASAKELGKKAENDVLPCPDMVLGRGPLAIAAYLENTPPFDAAFWRSAAFRSLSKAFDAHKGWPGLINWVNLQNELEQVRAKSEGVQLITMHAAKGLEFKVVFVPALEDGLMPFVGAGLLSGHASLTEGQDMAEELRLFYVSVTRAREGLFLSRAAKRFLYGRELRLKPSRFLSRLPLAEIKRSALVSVQTKMEKQLSLL